MNQTSSRKTVTFTTANRIISATTADASLSTASKSLISDETRDLIERLLLERLSLRGICRAVGVGLKWLLGFLVQCIEDLPDHLNVQAVSCTQDVMIQRLEVEADEMASFVVRRIGLVEERG